MGATERHTLPIPYGHHVYVVSDLSLSPRTEVASRPLVELTALLGDIDDPAIVVVAGNLFFPSAERELADDIAATLAHLPDFVRALGNFINHDTHHVYVLPGIR